jgi:hypothetical protein
MPGVTAEDLSYVALHHSCRLLQAIGKRSQGCRNFWPVSSDVLKGMHVPLCLLDTDHASPSE